MTQHKHNTNCVPLAWAHEFVNEITGDNLSRRWIYSNAELKPHFQKSGNGCISQATLSAYAERNKIISSDNLKLLIQFAGEHGLTQADIAREADILYISLWHYATNKRILRQHKYDAIASAIDKLLQEKQQNER